MSQEAAQEAADTGSRARVEQLGEMVKALLDESIRLIEHHVPTAKERKEGFETRKQSVASAALAYAAFTEAWKHLRDAHGGRG